VIMKWVNVAKMEKTVNTDLSVSQEKLHEALNCYIDLHNGYKHPKELMYPCETEKCCLSLQRGSLSKHVSSIKHIANVFDVDEIELRKLTKRYPELCKSFL